jgi:hypothetical protein
VDELWQLIFAVVVGCTFLSTLRVSVFGWGRMPTNPIARAISHDGWNAMLFIFIPWFLGSFARREVSPLPWVAFSEANARHGMADGIFWLAIVVVVDLWLLWIPAHCYAIDRPEVDKRIVVMARLLNLAIGLLIVTPDNPIYKIIGLIPSPDPNDLGY